MPWVPLTVAAMASLLVVGLRSAPGEIVRLQLVAVLLAGAAGFALDDAAVETLAGSPTGLLRRRLLRVVLVLPPVIVVWAVSVSVQGTAGWSETLAVHLLFAGLLGLSLGIAGVAMRRTGGPSGGITVVPTLLVLSLLSSTIPPSWRPLPFGDVPGGWTQIYLRWGVAALIGVVVFLGSSRDPAARRLLSR